MACTWYTVNSQSVIHYVQTASFGPVAESYGSRESFAAGFVKWCAMAWTVFFLRPVALLLATLTILGAAKRLQAGKAEPPRRQDVLAGAALLQLLLTLGIFSLSPVRETRYLVALLPLVGTVACWALVQHGEWAARVVIVALVIQLVLTHTQVLGLWPTRPPALRADVGMAPDLYLVHRDARPAGDLAAIVARTCPPAAHGVFNFVGVDVLHLSGHALTYAAAKERLAGRAGHCRYDSVGFASVEAAESEVKARHYLYWITVDPEIHPVPAYHAFLNQSAPVLLGRLRRRGLLEREAWDGPEGILLFRFAATR
jgi:hypothetical protein